MDKGIIINARLAQVLEGRNALVRRVGQLLVRRADLGRLPRQLARQRRHRLEECWMGACNKSLDFVDPRTLGGKCPSSSSVKDGVLDTYRQGNNLQQFCDQRKFDTETLQRAEALS